MEEPMSDARETRRFEIQNTLTGHCGKQLSPDLLEAIGMELMAAIEDGPCAWAFKTLAQPNET